MNRAAGILFICAADRTFLLARRSPHVRDPGLWSTPGGMVEKGEKPFGAATREVVEEMGSAPDGVVVDAFVVVSDIGLVYTTFVCDVSPAEKARWRARLNYENDAAMWFSAPPPGTHPGAAEVLRRVGAP